MERRSSTLPVRYAAPGLGAMKGVAGLLDLRCVLRPKPRDHLLDELVASGWNVYVRSPWVASNHPENAS
jgi:hypothetical protein